MTLPSTVSYNGIAYDITALGDYAFRDKSLDTISIPSKIDKLGVRAFQNCVNLSSVTITVKTANGKTAKVKIKVVK